MADKPKNQAASPAAPVKPAVVAKTAPAAAPVAPAKPAVPAAKPTVSLAPPAKTITPAERYKLIAEAAYYLAEKRGFATGHEAQDWLTAEKNVDAMLRTRR